MKQLLPTLILILTCFSPNSIHGENNPASSAFVNPTIGVAGDFGTWTVTYRCGSKGLQTNGAIRVQLPDSWHAGDRNSANPLQATNPRADHFVSARCTRPGVLLETVVEGESDNLLVKSSRTGLDGRNERYVFVVRIRLLKGELESGDTIDVIYGDTSSGGRGMRAAIISTQPEPILLAEDTATSGNFQLLGNLPTLESRSGPAAELQLIARSQAVLGQGAELKIAVTDSNANPVSSFRSRLHLELIQGEADFPAQIEVNLENGWGSVEFNPRKVGILRFKASTNGGLLKARSNPVKVEESPGEYKIFWGDLHSHSRYSWDGVGRDPFVYARHVSGLDFYTMTDHSIQPSEGSPRGLGPHVWDDYKLLAESHNDPPEFVTLHAYECSFGSPYGHHNVYFRDQPGPLLSPDQVTLPELWEPLNAGTALTIPHHTGKFPAPIHWDVHDEELRRNLEIYSAHGHSEYYDPDHPLAFEQSDFTSPSKSLKQPQYAQDAWRAGLALSTVASSDDHRAQPGQPHWGLTAVKAPHLTRTEVFDALYARRTYGTTGVRTLLEFSINGRTGGEDVLVRNTPELRVEAHGYNEIEQVEILRYCKSDGGFQVIFSFSPQALDFSWSNLDWSFREDSIYYVRLRETGEVRGRISMAWSSPIWARRNDK